MTDYTVTAVLVHTDPAIIYLKIDSETLKTSAEYLFYVIDNAPWRQAGEVAGWWAEASDLAVGDAIRQADGMTGMVQAVVVVQRRQPMYNLTVAVAHTFFVGDQQWLVHNVKCTSTPPRLHHSSLPQGERDALYDTVQKVRNGDTNGLHAHKYNNSDDLLPTRKGVTYTAYDVAPSAGTMDRGTRRVIVGSDGSMYYTNSHYGDTGGNPFYLLK